MKNKKICLIATPVIIILLYLSIQFLIKSSLIAEEESIDIGTGKSVSLSIQTSDLQANHTSVNKKNSHYEDIKFVDEEVFSIIEKAYNGIDFLGEFRQGDKKVYNFYKNQYHKLLKCETTFFNVSSQKETYINEFVGAINYDVNDYLYSFFDMDDDGAPELCITTNVGYIYIFKYYADSCKFTLWYEIHTSFAGLLGSKKLWYHLDAAPMQYTYYRLNEDGDEEYVVRFSLSGYYNTEKQQDDIFYMLSLPQLTNKNNQLSEKMKSQAFVDYQGISYFKVTKEQGIRLTENFFKARESAKESIKEVTFTYEELFGDL